MSMADDYQELKRFKKHLHRLQDNLEWLLPRLEELSAVLQAIG